ncbi:MAG: UTP--glucose-1-phosphate uridylyltransferase [Clostridia bacterium]|nr:UTP--glucose-1-phosphate uridylyltransferase [Clostridia bacterium]
MERYNNIIEKLEKYGQTHLLRFYDELTEDEKEVLLRQIDSVDFEEIKNITSCNNTCDNKENSSFSNNEISPIDVVDKYELNEEEKQNYTQIGEDLIKKGKVAVCTMAGGQGSRLGHDGPKGTFVVPLKTPKSIFQISTEHLLDAYKKYGNYINWYIMTSEDNDAVTRKYFEENNYFGYSKEHVKFFKQGELPLLSFDGKILLKNKHEIFKAANGNGGIFKALEDNGIINELKEKEIEYIATCNVDNILIKPVDSSMFGLLKEKNAEIGIKSVIKRSPEEPVGVCCYKNGRPTVIEYIDLPKDLSEARNEDNTLKYGEVHFGSNYLSVKLIERIANEKLPYHSARKKNKYFDENGNFVDSDEVNSIKSEMFIFDGFEKAESALVYRVKREEEFAPIKYKEGEDSPETAVRMYEKYYNS